MTDQTAPAPVAPDAPDAPAAQAENTNDTATPATPGQPARRAALQAKPTSPPRGAEGTAKTGKEADPAQALKTRPDALAGEQPLAAGDSLTEDDLAPPADLQEFTQLIGMATPATATPLTAAGNSAASAASAATPAATEAVDTAPAPLRGRTAAVDGSGRSGDIGDAPQAKASDRAADKAAPRAGTSALTPGTDKLQAPAAALQDTPQARPTETPALPTFAATLAQAQAWLPGGAADKAPAATPTPLQAPLHSDAFAPELGTRVSLMAVNGVQTAELQLNPAEMGPVAVQIVVDGAQAQVSFHAVQAETRHALEQCLPDLAAALQAQGLTLSGGGVFQQTGRQAGGDNQAGSDRTGRAGTGGPGRDGSDVAAVSAPVRRTVGLLDTFA